MKVAAGIVTYNPEIECLHKNITAIVEQVDIIYIIDNNSKNSKDIEKLIKNYEKCHLKMLQENEGIAKALNIICEDAYKDGYEWILTLDQDSICPSNLIEEYVKYLKLENCAMLSAIIFDRNKKTVNTTKNIGYSEIKECITSGSLLKLSVWNEINGFDEILFIDGVDFDICYRIIKKGYKIYRINTVVLNHEIGKSEIKTILIWKVIVMHHSPFRKYYIARNNIYLARKNKQSVIKSILRNIKLLVLAILYENSKVHKIKNIIKGTIDGFFIRNNNQ